jgi:hypothetical protein
MPISDNVRLKKKLANNALVSFFLAGKMGWNKARIKLKPIARMRIISFKLKIGVIINLWPDVTTMVTVPP